MAKLVHHGTKIKALQCKSICMLIVEGLLKSVSNLFLPGLMTGDWREADRQPVWLDLTQGHHPEGSRYPDGEGWYRCHRGVHWARGGLHLLHWSVPTRRHTCLI